MQMSASVRRFVKVIQWMWCEWCTNLAQNGWTPLMTASFEGHTDVVQALIEAKASTSAKDEV